MDLEDIGPVRVQSINLSKRNFIDMEELSFDSGVNIMQEHLVLLLTEDTQLLEGLKKKKKKKVAYHNCDRSQNKQSIEVGIEMPKRDMLE